MFIDDFASSEFVDLKYGCDGVRHAAVDGSRVKGVTSGRARQGFSLIKEFSFVLFIFLKNRFCIMFELNLDGV
jgi:hypothetical protein